MFGLRGWPVCLKALAWVFVPLVLAQPQTTTSRAHIGELFQAARQAERAEDLAKAVSLYHDIIKLDPTIAEVWSNLGMALYNLDKYEEAISAFRKASVLKPLLLAPHLFAGLGYLKMGSPQKALAPLKAAIVIEPDQPEANLALADAYAGTEQFERAVRLLRDLLRREPKSEEVGYRLATSYIEWGTAMGFRLKDSQSLYGQMWRGEVDAITQPELGEASYRETVEQIPNAVEPRLALGLFLLEFRPSPERLQEAEGQFKKAKELAPRDLEVESAFVRLAVARQNFTGAMVALEAISATDPAFVQANLRTLVDGLPAELVARANELANNASQQSSARLDSYTVRLEQIKRMKSCRPLSAAENIALVLAAWHLHHYEDALAALPRTPAGGDQALYWSVRTLRELGGQVLAQTVSANPESCRSHLLLANFAVQKNDYDTARTEYQAAIAIQPHHPEVRLLYIRLLETVGDESQALKEARQSLAEFPSHPGLNYHAGALLLRTGEATAAAKCFEQSLQADPKFELARVGLADSYATLGQMEDAIRELKLVLNTDTDGTLHLRLGRWYLQSGRAREGEEAFAAAKQLKETAEQAVQKKFAARSSRDN